jgi:DNA-binding beta-propeller fold protein YncE
VASNLNVYVVDSGHNRIQKFTHEGVFIKMWGSMGTGNGQFNFNTEGGIAVDTSSNVFVADTYNNRIQKFTSEGAFVTKWGSLGTGNGELKIPRGLAIKSANVSFLEERVFVAENHNHRIHVFRPELLSDT